MKYLVYIVIAIGLLCCKKDVEVNDKAEDSGLLAYFPLDGNYTDESGNNNVLEVSGGNPEFVEGYKNEASTAILLNGEDDFLIASIANLDTFSISMWLESYRYFVGEWPRRRSTIFDFSNKQVYGNVDGLSGATQINCGINSEQIAGVDMGDGSKWFHFYMAASNEVKIYINGSLMLTEPIPDKMNYLSDIIYFGRASNDEEIELTYFYGKIDEIKIFNKVLNQAEIDVLSLNEQ